MNENKKEALKMFLEYIFEENGKTTEVETIVENYVNKKLKDYFDVVANKIDQINNETTQLKKDFQELSTIDDKILVKLDEIKKSVKTNQPRKLGLHTMPSLEVKHTTDTSTKTKSKNSTDEIILNKNDDEILNLLPEMTETECDKYFERIRSECDSMGSKTVSTKLINEPIVKNISKKTGLAPSTVNNSLRKLRRMKNIRFIRVNDIQGTPYIYVKIISDDVDENNVDGLYQFKQRFNNPGFELINNLYIKSKRGKTFDINAKQLKKLSKMVDGNVLTNSLFDDCCNYLTDCGVNSSNFECIIYHLVNGHFSIILSKYDKYLRQVNNPHFEVYNGTLRVNGKDTKLNVKEVKKMLDDIPYGYSDDVREEYVRGLIDKYNFCSSECIRLIVDSYDDYSLNVLLKKGENFVENNPQKRRERGII